MDTTHGTEARISCLVDDVFFMSIIQSAASKAGKSVLFLRANDPIPSLGLLIVDLQYAGDWETSIKKHLAAGGRAIAYGPHVEASLFKRARAAGCERVLAKSKFVTDLPRILMPNRRVHASSEKLKS